MGIVDALISPGGGVANLLDDIIKRVWKDPIEASKVSDSFKLQLAQMQQAGQLAVLDANLKTTLAQLQINDDEAKSSRLFIAGARAFIEWVCGVGLGYQIVARPFLSWASAGWWHIPIPPTLDMHTLGTLITMLLGVGTLQVAHNVFAK